MRPAEYAANVLAAAIKEGHEGPVFIQGDHFQVNASRYKEDAEQGAESAARPDERSHRERTS